MKKLFFMTLCLFQMVFVYFDDGTGIGRILQLFCSLVLFLLIPQKYELFRQKEFIHINNIVAIYALYLVVSSVIGTNIQLSEIKHLILIDGEELDYKRSSYIFAGLAGVNLISAILFMEYLNNTNKYIVFLNYFYKILFVYLLINDVLMLLKVNVFEGFTYFLGDKFIVSYYHILLLVVMCVVQLQRQYYVSRIKLGVFMVYAVFASIYTECTTALFGVVFVFCMMKFFRITSNLIYSKNLTLILWALCSVFFFVFGFFLQEDWVTEFLISIGEDPTLSGRTDIYAVLMDFIAVSPLTGYGYGNASRVLMFAQRLPDAQNGLLDIVLSQGIIGCAFFVYIYSWCLKRIQLYHIYSYMPIIVYLLMYIFLSMVEITTRTEFLVLAIMTIPFLDDSKIKRKIL